MPLPLPEVLRALERLAPLRLAESWDNVGLLLPGRRGREISRVALTIDLTRGVVDEVLERSVDLVVAYHPPIFKGLQRLRWEVPMESAVLALVENGVALYSPHSALDAAETGMNHWLATLAGAGKIEPLVPAPEPLVDPVSRAIVGQGRVNHLAQPSSVASLVERFREGTGAPHLRLAPTESAATIVDAVIVGAGASGPLFGPWLARFSGRALVVSGEIRHHDALGWAELGHAVLQLEHDASERGFLPSLRDRLSALVGGVEVQVATADRPLYRCV
jgi:dinuclear metal center YbgI/SA1388 family protein